MDASKQFGVPEPTIRQRSHREQWPMPERVSRIVTRVAENALLAEKMAETWAEKGEKHRALAFSLASRAMEAAMQAPPEVKDWADLERVDKMARRAAGLDQEQGGSVMINMQLLGDRVEDAIDIDASAPMATERLPE